MYTKPLRGIQPNLLHPLSRGCICNLPFNEGCGNKVFDYSGYGNHGTLENMAFPPTTVSGWNAGRRGTGLRFDGTNDYINCGNDPSLDITDAITIEAWVKIPSGLTSQSRIISKRNGGTYWWELTYRGDSVHKVSFDLAGWANQPYSYTSIAVNDNNWHHIVGTRVKNDKLSIYLDGQFQESKDDLGLDISNTADVLIGKRSSQYFNGSIDGVKIYNRALSVTEIQQQYMYPYAMFEPAGIGMLYPPAAAVPNSNLAAMQVLMR